MARDPPRDDARPAARVSRRAVRSRGYIGFDPTGDSLHIGHLIPIFGLIRLQRHGGQPVALVGGGTGMIGDPSGRSSERNLLDLATLEHNVAAIRGQLERFLDFSPGPTQAEMVNNLDWLGTLSLIDYLRDVGKHFTVPYMLAKDSVQQRLDRGLSFTEFSYMTLQALDFATLYREHGVEMQMGGADQWGNITAGLELIRRTSGDGDESPGARHRLQAAAVAVGREVRQERGRRVGVARPGADDALRVLPVLAQHGRPRHRDVPALVHDLVERDEVEALDARGRRAGPRRARRSGGSRSTSRPGSMARRPRARPAAGPRRRSRIVAALSCDDLEAMRDAGAARRRVAREALGDALSVAIAAGAYSSNGEARRAMQGGGFYVNDERVTDPAAPLPEPLHEPVLARPDRQAQRPAGRARGLIGALRPAPETALVLDVSLPPGLEAFRVRTIADATAGVPAHVTLLYPFAEEAQLDAAVLGRVAGIAARHPVLRLTLGEGRRFPDTLYASVEPDAPLRALQDELAAAFPSLPLYGGAFRFDPHVTIVEGPAASDPGALEDAAWATLPNAQVVDAIDLITGRNGRWATRRRFPLGTAASSGRQARTLCPWRARSAVDDGTRLDAALRQQHQRVVDEVRRLAGEQGAASRSGRRRRPRPPRRSSPRAGPRSPPR